MNAMKSIKLGSLFLLGTLAVACAAPAPPKQAAPDAKLPPAGPDQEYKVTFPDLGRGEARYIRLSLGKDISQDCGLVKTQFEFDSSEPLPQEKLELKQLSECLDEPSRQGLGLLLVGRADRRGSQEYNRDLGLRRAARVKQILVNAGVAEGRIAVDTEGSRGAVGNDGLYSYGFDRRVDVVVFGVTHAPR
jgi:OmpA-OmpF porin, OOP family